jgi:hypothetical protein
VLWESARACQNRRSHPYQSSYMSERIPFTQSLQELVRTGDHTLYQSSYMSERLTLKTVSTKLALALLRTDISRSSTLIQKRSHSFQHSLDKINNRTWTKKTSHPYQPSYISDRTPINLHQKSDRPTFKTVSTRAWKSRRSHPYQSSYMSDRITL